MYYGAIKKYDIANGEGVRVSLFVSGCRNRCKGCFQPETWDFTYGVLTAEEFRYLQSLFSGKDTFRFRDGDSETQAYCAKSSVRLWDRTRGIYRDLRFTVIEC